MLKLITALIWLEGRFLRNRLILIGFIFLTFIALGFSDDAFRFSFSSRDAPGSVGKIPWVHLLPYLSPHIFVILAVGMVILMAPFRGRSEWEDGQWQMYRMSDFSVHRILLVRYGIHLGFALLLFVSVSAITIFRIVQADESHWGYVPNFHFLSVYAFLTVFPLLLGLVTWIAALNTAFYECPSSKILDLAKFLGIWGLIHLFWKLFSWVGDLPIRVIPATRIVLRQGLNPEVTFLYWEVPVIFCLLTAGFLFWAGIILNQLEA